MVGRSDLVLVPGSVWNEIGYLNFQPKNEHETGSINQTYIRKGSDTIFYDLYLNLAQMKRVWSDINLQDATEEIR
jgi:hypothetical protein